MNLETLLLALAGAPTLPGARCRGRHHLFDEAAKGEPADVVEQRHAQALGLCRTCPALASCQRWYAELPRNKRPGGVVAGKINPAKPGRPPASTRKETA